MTSQQPSAWGKGPPPQMQTQMAAPPPQPSPQMMQGRGPPPPQQGRGPPQQGRGGRGPPYHHQQGRGRGQGQGQGRSNYQHQGPQERVASPVSIAPSSGIPYGHVPGYLPGSSSLVEELDQRLLMVLRDGRHLVGVSICGES
jgi:hypothetical protein